MAWLKRVCIAAAFLVVVFIGFLLFVDNKTLVALRLLHRETEPAPVFWWLYAAFALGLFLGCALCWAAYLRGRFGERRLRRTLREREEELARLRSAPRLGADAVPPAP